MPIDDDESREQGVEFGPLADDLENEEYPMSSEELMDAYGDRELDLQDGGQTLREILEPLGKATYESDEDVKQGVIGMVGDEAVGRKGETDRGVASHEDEEDEESV